MYHSEKITNNILNYTVQHWRRTDEVFTTNHINSHIFC